MTYRLYSAILVGTYIIFYKDLFQFMGVFYFVLPVLLVIYFFLTKKDDTETELVEFNETPEKQLRDRITTFEERLSKAKHLEPILVDIEPGIDLMPTTLKIPSVNDDPTLSMTPYMPYASYVEYLSTPKWQEIRFRAFERDDYVCQDCGTAVSLSSGHAHHLTYDRLGDELLEDIQTLCRYCHMKVHYSN